MKTLEDIQALAKAHADARGILAERVTALQDEIETIKRRRLPGIRLAVGAARETRELLEQAVDSSRPLFADPRTVTAHGIRFGLQKGKGKVSWAKSEVDKIVAAIERKLGDRAAVLIKVEKKPVKKALQQLTVQEIKSIGCTVVEAGDHVFVKAQEDDVDKLVSALLGEDSAEGSED